jgi:DNA ligase (NAD+)
LGIHGIGEVTADDLARIFKSLDNLARATLEELERIENIGPSTSAAILDWFAQTSNRELLNKLQKVGLQPVEERPGGSGTTNKLAGKMFVITGTLPSFSREALKTLINKNGGKVSDSLSKNTSYLVVGENPGSKMDKANKLDIPQLSEKDLLDLLDKNT